MLQVYLRVVRRRRTEAIYRGRKYRPSNWQKYSYRHQKWKNGDGLDRSNCRVFQGLCCERPSSSKSMERSIGGIRYRHQSSSVESTRICAALCGRYLDQKISKADRDDPLLA